MRPDDLATNKLVASLKQANRQFEDLRTTQQGFGSRSVRKYRIFSGDPYDLEVTGVGFNNRVIEVTFIPDSLESDGLGGVIDFDYVLTHDSGSFVTALIEPLLPVAGISKWRIYLSGSDAFPAAWARVKVFVFANGSGTISCALL